MSERKECDDCLEQLYPYLDRELSPEELVAVQGHLSHCVGCDDVFVLERVFLDQVRDRATSETCPPAVRERLIIRIREDARRSS